MTGADRELCRVCGTPLYGDPLLRPDRLCPRHLAEARAACPPFACTLADLAARDPDDDPICEECNHPWSKHEFGGCVQLTARFVTSYGKIIEDTGPYRCGCEAYDPMCVSPGPPSATVTTLPERRREPS